MACQLLSSSVIAEEVTGELDVDFNRDIRPILSDHCFYCHGFDGANREAGLRLDTFDGAVESGALVPGDAEASEMLRRMLSDDPDEVMPPPETEKPLSSSQIELVQQWIKQGGRYQQHWSWRRLEKPSLPKPRTHPIDAFLARRWKERSVEPTRIADPRTRLRRLSFDLRGIPPTFSEVRSFQSDPSLKHFLAFRDRWMSELEFAEHQAVRWLDLVRWADTSGFVSDEPIASGAYRAWVVESFLNNTPFDEFSIAQLAGDLFENPSDDDLIASGFNRIVNTNCEAGAIEAEQLYKLKGEHVRALGTVWLGLTTGCAECHDHKFDPISAKDYYSLAAYFDDLVEAGVYTPGDRREPLHYVHPDPKPRDRDRDISRRIDELKQQIFNSDPETSDEADLKALLSDTQSRRDFVWIPGQIPAARIVQGDFESMQSDSLPNLSTGDGPINDPSEANVYRRTVAAPDEFKRHHVAELMTGYIHNNRVKTNAEQDVWFVDVWIDPNKRPQMIGVQISHGDYGRLGWRTANYETYYWGDDSSGTIQQPQPWSDPKRVKRLGPVPKEEGWVRLKIPFAELINPEPGQNFEAVGMAWLQTGGNVRWGNSGLTLRTDKATELALAEVGIRKWWDEPYNRQVYQSRAEYVAKSLRAAFDKRNALQQELVREILLTFGQDDRQHLRRLAELRQLESQLFQLRSNAMPVLVSKSDTNRKQTRLLNRGDYQDKTGPIVNAAPPEFLAGNRSKEIGGTRLDLATWLFENDNPIVARVFVNRLWQQFYGRGLSETLDDAGQQGDWPSHVELLDWLASEFRDSGWDRNHMIRLMTSANAYGLASRPSAEVAEIDPKNRLHARQSRFRLSAESIRDSALAVAGLLEPTREIPIESFYPYQPDVYWTSSDKVMYGSRHLAWNTSRSATQYSRSLYTFWKRQNIHPTMLTFDAPTRQECTAQRNITNTPGQALALLNDPIFVEAARGLATRLFRGSNATEVESDAERIQLAFTWALQRPANDQEIDILTQLLIETRAEFASLPEDATAFVQIGQSKSDVEVENVELASWVVIARAILNLHEFINRP